MSRAHHSRGFTLVELMIVLTLLSVLAFIAIPSFTEFTRANRVQATAEELKAFLVAARTEALNNRAPVIVKITAAKWEWEIRDNQDKKLRILELDPQPQVTSLNSLTELKYTANGTAELGGRPARFTVCYEQDTKNGHMISVQPSGAVRLYPKGRNDSNATLSSCQ